MPVFSRIAPTIAGTYGLQTLLALLFVPRQEDRFFDLGGALGFLSSTFLSLYYPTLKTKFYDRVPGIQFAPLASLAPRQILLSAALGIWSTRLGIFLTSRSVKTGGDSRFNEIKKRPKSFTYYWLAQATWISLVGLPVYLCNAIPASLHPALTVRDYAALGLFVGSFLFEVVADYQKSAWRRRKHRKQHDEQFITSGLWGISRHPNYVGEVGIWTGIWALSTTALQTVSFPRGTVALAALSPLFTWFLVRNVSGVPSLERSGNKKFGNDPKWQHYIRTVPIFWPWGSVNQPA